MTARPLPKINGKTPEERDAQRTARRVDRARQKHEAEMNRRARQSAAAKAANG